MYPIITKLGGRRFILAVYGITLVSVMFMNGHLKDEENYKWLLVAFIAIYTGSNVGQKVANIKAGITE